MSSLSPIRILLMRVVFFLNAVPFGFTAWSRILAPPEMWDPIKGIAYSFLAALSVLSLIGVRFPQTMLPVLLLQFLYKTIWFAAVAYPLWAAGQLPAPMADPVFRAFVIGIVADLVAIPWLHVGRTYVVGAFRRTPGVT